MNISPILQRIVDNKKTLVRHAKDIYPLPALLEAAERKAAFHRPFAQALGGISGEFKIIAEIKRSSPSHCFFPTGFDPVAIGRSYQDAGAACLSVLTEERFFLGSPLYLPMVKEAVSIPVLRKDFVVDPWQVAEAAALGADAVLLMAVLFQEREQMAPYFDMAAKLGIELLVEVHSQTEWEMARFFQPPLVGINNRDFRSPELDLDIESTVRLAPLIPDYVTLVSESGLSGQGQLGRLASLGVDGFLIGSAFMKTDDPGAALRELIE
ncbi:MAG: indole-3-glycerol phosphate synthase TrpC [Nitrospinota bacterium]|nr:indole-3-glycerol phosphate synthase TrpC [Nitrospinota bacterium]